MHWRPGSRGPCTPATDPAMLGSRDGCLLASPAHLPSAALAWLLQWPCGPGSLFTGCTAQSLPLNPQDSSHRLDRAEARAAEVGGVRHGAAEIWSQAPSSTDESAGPRQLSGASHHLQVPRLETKGFEFP